MVPYSFQEYWFALGLTHYFYFKLGQIELSHSSLDPQFAWNFLELALSVKSLLWTPHLIYAVKDFPPALALA